MTLTPLSASLNTPHFYFLSSSGSVAGGNLGCSEAPFVMPGQIPSHLTKPQLEFRGVQGSLRLVDPKISSSSSSSFLCSSSSTGCWWDGSLACHFLAKKRKKRCFPSFLGTEGGAGDSCVCQQCNALAGKAHPMLVVGLVILVVELVGLVILVGLVVGHTCQRCHPVPVKGSCWD